MGDIVFALGCVGGVYGAGAATVGADSLSVDVVVFGSVVVMGPVVDFVFRGVSLMYGSFSC